MSTHGNSPPPYSAPSPRATIARSNLPMSTLIPVSASMVVSKPLPTSYADVVNCTKFNPEKPVAIFEPGVVIKFGGDREEEVRALEFLHDKLSFRIPQVIYHPPYHGTSISHLTLWKATGVWYFLMEELPGVTLESVIDTMTVDELNHVADQLSGIMAEMRQFTSTTIGSVAGGPLRNAFCPWPCAPESSFSSVEEFISYYQDLLSEFCAPDYVTKLLECLPRDASVHLVHGDLYPRNILVSGSTITSIIDWELAGFYPDFWEYALMHYDGYHGFNTPGWDYILARLFPEPYRENVVATVAKIISLLQVNLLI